MKSENERLLIEILTENYPGQWVNEHMGIEGRQYRFDAANIRHKVAIEIEGGIHPYWTTIRGKRVKVENGRHTRPNGYAEDCKKYNLAVINGWKILRYTSDQLRKTPWEMIRDLYTLIGAPTNKQAQLCLDGASTGAVQIQQRIYVDRK